MQCWIWTLLFYRNGFIKTLWSSIPINAPFCYLLGLASNNVTIKNSKEENILRTYLGSKLNFSMNLTSITKIANIKLNSLSIVQTCMTQEQKILFTFSFIKCLFNYCPLIWMFRWKKALHRLNNIHEKSLLQ